MTYSVPNVGDQNWGTPLNNYLNEQATAQAAHIAADSGVHGVSGAVVGTSDTQVLTHKDLSSTTNTLPAYINGDTGWINLSMVAGFTVSGAARYRAIGKRVTVQVDGAFTTVSGTNATITSAPVPSQYWPSVQSRSAAYFAGYAGIITMGTDGEVSVVQNTGANRASVSGTFSYLVD